MAWIVFLAIAIPLLAVVAWMLLDESIVRIPPDRIGLLLVHGAATDKTIGPGSHWVPAFRRRTVQEYPANELAYRAGDRSRARVEAPGDQERAGPAIVVTIGDRTEVVLGYTVRFALDRHALRVVHERFGGDGIWSAARDLSERAVRAVVGAPDVDVDDLFGPARVALEDEIAEALRARLVEAGLVLTMFALGDLDLGRSGDVVQATSRARLELAREEAEAAVRQARARIDAELAPVVDGGVGAAALRYRELDSWRELATAGRAQVVIATGAEPAPVGDEGGADDTDADRA